ncbi:MAG TPA: glycosyltransferase family 39 protein [Gaiella sp.]|uniref:glycosyltransferase family 39 protein n=1 Tax=Gaiella sp. TaxID=2663207 RepID=UPI002D805686|nr:glycosyltransferase family 39 protein [Gaiella sp.]HET9287097.1 glycosyltransferase family 39 protein [Gaiella sp.]
MTQGIEARVETAPVGAARTSVRARLEAHGLWLAVAGVTVAAAAFLLHQLMAWPPHEDETLALFVGRDSLPGVIEHVTRDRGGAPLHFLLAWAVAHLGFGLGALRLLSAFFAIASLPLVAALGVRLAGARVALVATVLVASSWLLLFHGVYGRMYSLFLFGSLACTLALLEALQHGGRGRWALWVAAALLVVATHPYGVLLLGGQAVYVLLEARDRLREAIIAGAAVLVCGIPFWLTDLVLADRFDVGVGGGGEKLGGPWAVARYLWRSAGDATAGWWPVTVAVLVAAAAGVVLLRREARTLVLALLGVTVVAFVVAKLGGSAAPESRHLIFLAPLLAIAVGATLVRAGRRVPAVTVTLTAVLVVFELAWAWHRTPPLFEWEPDARQAARADAEAWLALTSRPDDVLFGYEPLYLGAWERNRSFPTTVVPRADARLALRTIERGGQLGRGVWVLDASERNNIRPRLEIEYRIPEPGSAFRSRMFGPFLVVRTVEPVVTPETFLYYSQRALLVGQQLGIGDADINLRTAVLAARELRGYGPSLRSRSSNSR